MMQVKIDIEHLSKLAKIKCDEKEKEEFLNDLHRILKFVESLNEVDTSEVQHCGNILDTLYNVFREDEIKDLLSRDDFLANAPSQIAAMIRVPAVLKSEN
jgi:aspartyl-tRNA(Asn)/glutamyl-tRNA(Gln) amidotransferase subunit C